MMRPVTLKGTDKIFLIHGPTDKVDEADEASKADEADVADGAELVLHG